MGIGKHRDRKVGVERERARESEEGERKRKRERERKGFIGREKERGKENKCENKRKT